ncbi:MAG: PadR family transcriptional regulator [Lachnospiraceae bacterium]|nr:PadR family transcriptional regulator [Lachnospiraceae bacterium]
MDVQLRKGLLEFCVLAAIRESDSYGYQMIKEISEYIAISESTLYPILRRMEASGKVMSYSVEYHNRIRRYFHLTEAGREALNGFVKEKEEIMRVLAFITGGVEDE